MQEPSKLGKIVLISMRCRMKLTEKKQLMYTKILSLSHPRPFFSVKPKKGRSICSSLHPLKFHGIIDV